MQEARGRLSIPFGRLTRSRDNASTSATSPKSTESSPRLQNPTTDNTDNVASPPTRQSVPASTGNRPRGVQRVMTEPLRTVPTAVIARPRSVSHPSTPTAAIVSSSPVRTPIQRGNVSTKPEGRFRRLLNSMNLKNRSNRKPSKSGERRPFGLILTLLIFCMTAIVCTYFSLMKRLICRHLVGILAPKFPQFHPYLLYWTIVCGILVRHSISAETCKADTTRNSQ